MGLLQLEVGLPLGGGGSLQVGRQPLQRGVRAGQLLRALEQGILKLPDRVEPEEAQAEHRREADQGREVDRALEPGDVHEEDAGRRLAAAVTGDGVEVKGYTGGQWTLAATRRGLLRIDTVRLTEANAHEGISVFTLFTGQPVEAGESVAKAKVTPLAIGEATIAAIEAAGRGLVAVAAFRPTTIGAVANERLEPRQRADAVNSGDVQ